MYGARAGECEELPQSSTSVRGKCATTEAEGSTRAVSGAGREGLGGVGKGPLTGGVRQLGSPDALRRIEDKERDAKNTPLQCAEGAAGISQVSLGERKVREGHLTQQSCALPRMEQ